MLSPPTTGPTGTYGGAKDGTGPLPITCVTCCVGNHIDTALANPVAIDANSSLEYGPGTASLRVMVVAMVPGCSEIGDISNMVIGVGLFGVGGAIASGKIAKVGYHFRPGTRTERSHSRQHDARPSAI